MESFRTSLARVAEACTRFASDPDVRVLHIGTTPTLQKQVLDVVCMAEHHPANDSPFFFLESHAWADRRRELELQYDTLRELVKGAAELPAFPAAGDQDETPHSGIDAFVGIATDMVAAFPTPVESAVLVLVSAERSDRSTDEARALVSKAQGTPLRLVVVDDGAEHIDESALYVTTEPPPEDTEGALRDSHEALDRAVVTGVPAQVAGGAGPRTPAPPRANALPEPTQEDVGVDLNAQGVPGVYADRQTMAAIRSRLSAGLVALQDDKPAEAVDAYEKAAGRFQEEGLFREALLIRLALAGLLVQTGNAERAAKIFQACKEEARGWNLPSLAAQAALGRASLFLLCRDHTGAGEAFLEAADLSVSADEPLLAIEAYRTAGQAFAEAEAPARATECWAGALTLAEGLPTENQSLSSAPAAARSLADVYRKQGAHAQAQSLEAVAKRLAELEEPEAPTGEAPTGVETHRG